MATLSGWFILRIVKGSSAATTLTLCAMQALTRLKSRPRDSSIFVRSAELVIAAPTSPENEDFSKIFHAGQSNRQDAHSPTYLHGMSSSSHCYCGSETG